MYVFCSRAEELPAICAVPKKKSLLIFRVSKRLVTICSHSALKINRINLLLALSNWDTVVMTLSLLILSLYQQLGEDTAWWYFNRGLWQDHNKTELLPGLCSWSNIKFGFPLCRSIVNLLWITPFIAKCWHVYSEKYCVWFVYVDKWHWLCWINVCFPGLL